MPGLWLTSRVVSSSFRWAVGSVLTVTGERKKKKNHSSHLSVSFDSPFGLATFLSSYVKSQLCPRYPFMPFIHTFFFSVRPSHHTLACGLRVILFKHEYVFSTEKENPYEDVDLKRKSLGRKLETNRSWTMDKKLSSPPQVRSSLRSFMLHCIKSDGLVLNKGQCWFDNCTVHFAILPFGRSPSQ